MKIKCYNKKCGHERNYKGKYTDDNSTITCTKCRYKLKLGRAKIKSEVGLPHEVTSQKGGNIEENSEVTSLPHSQYKKEIVQPQIEKIEKDHYNKKDSHGKKYRPYEKHLGTIKEIPSKIKILRIIPLDPIKLLEHQRSFL